MNALWRQTYTVVVLNARELVRRYTMLSSGLTVDYAMVPEQLYDSVEDLLEARELTPDHERAIVVVRLKPEDMRYVPEPFRDSAAIKSSASVVKMILSSPGLRSHTFPNRNNLPTCQSASELFPTLRSQT